MNEKTLAELLKLAGNYGSDMVNQLVASKVTEGKVDVAVGVALMGVGGWALRWALSKGLHILKADEYRTDYQDALFAIMFVVGPVGLIFGFIATIIGISEIVNPLGSILRSLK